VVCAVVFGEGVFVSFLAGVVALSWGRFAVKKCQILCGYDLRFCSVSWQEGVWGALGGIISITKLDALIVYKYC
jgi:hypothetical protein